MALEFWTDFFDELRKWARRYLKKPVKPKRRYQKNMANPWWLDPIKRQEAAKKGLETRKNRRLPQDVDKRCHWPVGSYRT
jgi:hypothetical protein